MHLKHSMMTVTTSSNLPLVSKGQKHSIEDCNYLFFLLAHKQVQEGQEGLQDSQGSFKTILNAHFCEIQRRIY